MYLEQGSKALLSKDICSLGDSHITESQVKKKKGARKKSVNRIYPKASQLKPDKSANVMKANLENSEIRSKTVSPHWHQQENNLCLF